MRTPTNERVSSGTFDQAKARTSEPARTRPRSKKARTARGKISQPERRCIVTGDIAPRSSLVRLVASPDGVIFPDAQAKAPGRGAWIGVTRDALQTAVANGKLKGGLARAFKTGGLTIPSDLPEQIEAALIKALLDRLGLELRIGKLVLGSQRIIDTARSGAVAMLCHAQDASEDGTSKLDQAWRVGSDKEGSGMRGMRLPLDRATLSVALGRENVVHFALNSGAAAERVGEYLDRLIHFLGDQASPPARGIDAAKSDADGQDNAAQPDELN